MVRWLTSGQGQQSIIQYGEHPVHSRTMDEDVGHTQPGASLSQSLTVNPGHHFLSVGNRSLQQGGSCHLAVETPLVDVGEELVKVSEMVRMLVAGRTQSNRRTRKACALKSAKQAPTARS